MKIKYKKLVLDLPLSVQMGVYKKGEKKGLPKKSFRLNLNIYRNTQHFTLNAAKVNYKQLIKEKLKYNKIKFEKQVYVIYKYTSGSRRKSDLMNILSITDKFVMDALVELGILVDDNYNNLPLYLMYYNGTDKGNENVELILTEDIDELIKEIHKYKEQNEIQSD